MTLGNMRELGVHHLICILSMKKTELAIQLRKDRYRHRVRHLLFVVEFGRP